MKRSVYHQIIGALVCAGRQDLVQEVIGTEYIPGAAELRRQIKVATTPQRKRELQEKLKKHTDRIRKVRKKSRIEEKKNMSKPQEEAAPYYPFGKEAHMSNEEWKNRTRN